MPIPVPSVGTLEVLMQFTQDAQEVENVFHVQNDAGWDFSKINTVLAIFVAWWGADVRPVAPGTLTLRRVIGRDLSPLGVSVEFTTGLPLSGTFAEPALPNSVTMAVKWTTGYAGRSYRGRTYHLGLTEGEVTGNTVLPGTLLTFISIYENLLDAVNDAVDACTLSVLSRVHNGAIRSTPVTTPITGVSIDPTVDNQRRRLPGRGR